MSEFIKKHGKHIIVVSVIVLILTAVFFLADGPEIKKNTQAPAGSVPHASGTAAVSEVSSPAPEDSAGIAEISVPEKSIPLTSDTSTEQSSEETAEVSAEDVPESSIGETQETVIEDTSAGIIEEFSEESTAEAPSESSEESTAEAPSESSEEYTEEIPEEISEEIPVSSQEENKHQCTFSIECSVLNEHIDDLAKNKRPIVPSDGIILSPVTIGYDPGESVFDITKRVCTDRRIHLEFTMTPLYNTAYIEGIYNLYEFDCGSASGWVYSINGEIPSYGCSDCKVSDGDEIVWHYTCALGNDIVF